MSPLVPLLLTPAVISASVPISTPAGASYCSRTSRACDCCLLSMRAPSVGLGLLLVVQPGRLHEQGGPPVVILAEPDTTKFFGIDERRVDAAARPAFREGARV